MNTEQPQFRLRVKWKRCAIRHEASERITVEVVSVRGVRRPIRIRVVWCDYFEPSARLGDSIQLVYESEDVGYVLNDVTTDDFVELVVVERIGEDAQVMNEVRLSSRIRIDTDRARKLVLPTPYVQNFYRGFGWGSEIAVEHTHQSN